MVKKIKNILNLTKVFSKNSFQSFNVIDEKTKKINKKSILVWLMIIVIIAISFLSLEIIQALDKINRPEIFLNFLFIILSLIMSFQVILASTNVYFFSKDMELILPFPIKSDELLISRFNIILINLYFSELIFAFFPLIIYGILTNVGFLFYFYIFFILLIFPILINLIISMIMILLMKLFKFIKNKNSFQIVITLILIFILFLFEFKIGSNIINKIDGDFNIENVETLQALGNFNEKIININKYFLEINPTIEILKNYNKINSIFYMLQIIFIDLFFIIIFIFIGNKFYLKNLLKSNIIYIKKVNKNILEKKINKSKKINKKYSYIAKEIKILIKNPIFFIQCVFPILILIISLVIIIGISIPSLKAVLTSDLFNEKLDFSLDLNVICLILSVIQAIFTISNISLTAISREGKDAIYMKFIPLDFYEQFKYKTIPQIILNMILIFVIFVLMKLLFSSFDFIYLIILFILANLLNIINSELMVLVDLFKPNLNWDSDYDAIKIKRNKFFQYALTIIIILLLIYFNKLFIDLELLKSCFLMIFVLIIVNLIIRKIIKVNINKFFTKIK